MSYYPAINPALSTGSDLLKDRSSLSGVSITISHDSCLRQKSTFNNPLEFILAVPLTNRSESIIPLSDSECLDIDAPQEEAAEGDNSGDGEDNEEDVQPRRKYCRNIKSAFGILLGLFSGFTNSLIALLIKLVETKSIFEIAGYRYAVMIPFLSGYLLYQKANPFNWTLTKRFGWVLVLRAVLGCGATFSSYFALQKLPLADASVIMFSSPVFVAIFARIFLKEPLRWSHGLAILTTLAGCILVARPPAIFGTMITETKADWNGKIWGYVAALASAMLTASVYIALRFMKEINSTIVSFYTATIGSVMSLIIAGSLQEFYLPTDARVIGSIFGVGLLSLASNESMNRALKLESAGLIALLRTFDIVWSFIWQLVAFRLVPHYLSVIGAVLVIICVSLLSMRETVKKLPSDSKVKIFVVKVMEPVSKAKKNVKCKTKTLFNSSDKKVEPDVAVHNVANAV